MDHVTLARCFLVAPAIVFLLVAGYVATLVPQATSGFVRKRLVALTAISLLLAVLFLQAAREVGAD